MALCGLAFNVTRKIFRFPADVVEIIKACVSLGALAIYWTLSLRATYPAFVRLNQCRIPEVFKLHFIFWSI